jgi:uncharacterized membrane protein
MLVPQQDKIGGQILVKIAFLSLKSFLLFLFVVICHSDAEDPSLLGNHAQYFIIPFIILTQEEFYSYYLAKMFVRSSAETSNRCLNFNKLQFLF